MKLMPPSRAVRTVSMHWLGFTGRKTPPSDDAPKLSTDTSMSVLPSLRYSIMKLTFHQTGAQGDAQAGSDDKRLHTFSCACFRSVFGHRQAAVDRASRQEVLAVVMAFFGWF